MRFSTENHGRRHSQVLVGLVVFATLGLAQLLGAYAAGVLFVSPTGNNANDCLTLAGACKTVMSAVGKAAAGDTIIIASGHYTEGIAINKDLTLIGFGADATILYQGTIIVNNASVRVYDLTITGGNNGEGGGGVFNNGGNVTLGRVSILNNHAYNGGGIYNLSGTLSLDYTTVAGNSSIRDGGGIYNDQGRVALRHSIVMSNSACGDACLYVASGNPTGKKPDNGILSLGGGIANYFGAMAIDSSAIISNSSASGGDGILNDGPLVITNSSISNNAGAGGDGIGNASVVTLTNVTLNGNALNLKSNSPARTYLRNTILANSTSYGNCTGGGIISLGHNLSSDASCNLNASGDMTNTNPLLGPLQDNGGPTPTQALLPGSPAINRGDDAGCPTTDQRGVARPQGVVCDIGAYEFVFSDTFFAPVMTR